MCGIAGILNLNRQKSQERLEKEIGYMTDSLVHRGPDDQGCWADAEMGIALGHRRLSIIDLSPRGRQPMRSASGRYTIVYNGEIYNYLELKQELALRGYSFVSDSDTEVILAALEAWGIEGTLKSDKLTGMFAFAVWDNLKKKLIIARDRIGEKPLYYGVINGSFYLTSELKALTNIPDLRLEIDRHALSLYLQYNYIPCPYSIYRDICKLEPGCFLVIDSFSNGHVISDPIPYWSAIESAMKGINNRYKGSEAEAIEILDYLLKDAIKKQMVSDVPLGAFLSGGIDSSTIVALMQAQSDRPIRTFTIGFNEDSYNEAPHALEVARHLGTDHTELYINPEQALGVIPLLSGIYDEPFADASQIPTFLVADLTRKHVAVTLSGDAGDELFGGYNRYFWGRSIWNKVGWLPGSLRHMGGGALKAISPLMWDRIFNSLRFMLPAKYKQNLPGDKIHKLANILAVDSPDEMYNKLVSCWKKDDEIVMPYNEDRVMTDKRIDNIIQDFTERMMYKDMVTYLPDDILVKVERACMAVSLEARVPFLDHRIIEFAHSLPLNLKIRDGQGKWILRQVLYKYVPKQLIERPKMGFGVPIDQWLRGPLREWAETLLDERRLKEECFFNPQPIRAKWEEHLLGKRNWQYHIWSILMFQAWYDKWKK